MDLHDIIDSIEDIKDPIDRCVAYSEVLLHLKHLKEVIYFHKADAPFKDNINSKLINIMKAEIDEGIETVRKFIEFNIVS